MPNRKTNHLKVREAYLTPEGQVHAVVSSPEGTMTVLLPDWADKNDIKQEAARLIEVAAARAALKREPNLED